MLSVGRDLLNSLVMDEAMVPASDPGIEIYVRNKRSAELTRFSADRTVIFVHGATYPAEVSFDLRLDGLSWMDYIAARGFDVYLLDIRGYGRSTRPPEMDEPPEKHPPIARTDSAVRDVSAVVDYVLRRRGIEAVNLLGWSWGTTIMAAYAAGNAAKVKRLVLYAPGWIRTTPSMVQVSGPLGAYRTVTRQQAFERWMTGIPEARKTEIVPPAWFAQWADATFASDPYSARHGGEVIRATNGVVLDSQEYWLKGRPLYDPARLTMPVMLVLAEWDRDTPPYMAQSLFPLLTNAPWKRHVLIGEGTHSVMMEKNRLQLFREVQLFLEEEPPTSSHTA